MQRSRESHQDNDSTVSVVVPSYNHARFIGRTLRSIIKQTHKPLEMIVIDDGSSDESLREIEKVLKDCPFPSDLVITAHKGLGSGLNEGLRRSSGTYFAYLGSDDLWLSNFLKVRIGLLQARPAAVLAYGHSFVIDEKDQILECTSDWAQYVDGQAGQMLLHRTAPFSPSVLYRRKAVERHGWRAEEGLEDYELYLRLSRDGEFAFENQVLCAWRSHSNNKSGNLDFMLSECLKAQSRVACSLNINKHELELAHAELKWRYAHDFIKAGQKRKAFRLIHQNLKGAPSFGSLVRTLIILAAPQRITNWRKAALRRRAIKRYGTIQI
jgi:alpha-1,3-rhamnosyltransferase